MDVATITLILQILIKYGPEAYKVAVGLFTKPTAVTAADFDKLTAVVNEPLHQ